MFSIIFSVCNKNINLQGVFWWRFPQVFCSWGFLAFFLFPTFASIQIFHYSIIVCTIQFYCILNKWSFSDLISLQMNSYSIVIRLALAACACRNSWEFSKLCLMLPDVILSVTEIWDQLEHTEEIVHNCAYTMSNAV